MKEKIEELIRLVEEIRFQPNRTYWPNEKLDTILSRLRSIKPPEAKCKTCGYRASR